MDICFDRRPCMNGLREVAQRELPDFLPLEGCPAVVGGESRIRRGRHDLQVAGRSEE